MKAEVQWLPLFSGNAPDSWRARNPHLFPSDESLRHFFRTHKRELVKEGAVALLRGQYQATERMTPVVHEIAKRAAKRAAEVA